MRNFDNNIGKWCAARGIAYTRYCDDMTFSSDRPLFAVYQKAKSMLEAMGFELNERKTRFVTRANRQSVTGLTVNEKVSVSGDYKRGRRQEEMCIRDSVYTYEYHESPRKDLSEDDGWRTEHILFDRFEDCLSCCLRDMQGAADRIRIKKRPVFHSNGTSGRRVQTLELNAEGKPLSIEAADEAEEDTDEVFDHMWFAFPTPFRCGDIVWNPAAAPGQPFVLDYLNTWNTVEMIEKGFMDCLLYTSRCV